MNHKQLQIQLAMFLPTDHLSIKVFFCKWDSLLALGKKGKTSLPVFAGDRKTLTALTGTLLFQLVFVNLLLLFKVMKHEFGG